MKLNDIRWPGGKDYQLSLVKLTGSPITDILGSLSGEFSDVVFEIDEIHFADGSIVSVQGEHDIAYVEDYDTPAYRQPKNLDGETLQRLYDELNDE